MKQLTILLASVNAVGHVNATLGATTGLVARGHRLIFVYEKAFAGRGPAVGVEEYVYEVQHPPQPESKQNHNLTPGELLANAFLESKVIGPFSVWEKMQQICEYLVSDQNCREMAALNQATVEAIEKFHPDLIYIDSGVQLPAVHYSGIPWIRQVSTTPGFFDFDPRLPPGGSGFPSAGDRSQWAEFQAVRSVFIKSREFNRKCVEALGYPAFPDDQTTPETQCFTIYGYPDELDYPEIRERESWFNLESFQPLNAHQEPVKLQDLVPVEFLDDSLDGTYSGKLIYLSMGSMGSVDLDLMSRLIEILKKTSHKYIVSKGPRHDEYSLPRNMWGGRYLPQLKILPHVDLVITHGGNNTTTETFAQGKPMIVLPLFGDQPDNAQRVAETGFGARLEPYEFTEEELLGAIERLLADDGLTERLHAAAVRLRQSKRHDELAERIEQLVGN